MNFDKLFHVSLRLGVVAPNQVKLKFYWKSCKTTPSILYLLPPAHSGKELNLCKVWNPQLSDDSPPQRRTHVYIDHSKFSVKPLGLE